MQTPLRNACFDSGPETKRRKILKSSLPNIWWAAQLELLPFCPMSRVSDLVFGQFGQSTAFWVSLCPPHTCDHAFQEAASFAQVPHVVDIVSISSQQVKEVRLTSS
ncbi:hypothetical protein B0H67DRAFT_161837 [Lasiosphaeris hirsuta]|uniref:Uncharacterized protein n=1 Tax=Lasiosphaeris hirsuta TaxID=260670 RepID=A0AA40DX85_9PEZI|nr:hypothetical protein B0H67DRAFT_161837 [Lasiosphaeris hirsuta]